MDLYIEHLFDEEMSGDTSFQNEGSFLGILWPTRFSVGEMKDTWNRGIKHGIEIGLRRASLEGQKIELTHNTPDGKNKEFLEKFYKLADEYQCAIQHHPQKGMVVIDRSNIL